MNSGELALHKLLDALEAAGTAYLLTGSLERQETLLVSIEGS